MWQMPTCMRVDIVVKHLSNSTIAGGSGERLVGGEVGRGAKELSGKREAGGYINRIGVVIDYFNAKRGKILLTDLVNESLGIIHFLYFCQFVSKLSILSTRSCKRCSYYLIRLRFSHLVKVNKMSYERDDEAPTDSLYPIAHPFATSTNQSSLLKHHPTAFVDCSDPTSFLQER
jgi:hypothetical protein